MTISSFNKGPDDKMIIEETISSFYIGPADKRILEVLHRSG